jgi:predicted double-glycine peptidase
VWFAVALFLATAGSSPQARPLLDVPFVAQTPELCGGAAVSMVMRYWGARDIVPEDFQSLVVPSERGIPTRDLTEAVRGRRWQAVIGPVDLGPAWTTLQDDVNRGRPVIALIEVSSNTYHYVVIVGLTTDVVVLHDPARAPFQVMARDAFERAWAVTKRWSMTVLPPVDDVVPVPTPVPTPTTAVTSTVVTPCSGMVDRGVALALEGHTADSEAVLLAATTVCAGDAAAWRELAGLRFTQKDWTEAARLAAVAVRLAPDDTHARQILATSRFLAGDQTGALEAWTPLGEPHIDTITVTGVAHTPHPTVIRASSLQARQLLTAESLARAERRVDELPTASRARLSFVPVDGLADVEIAMVEQDMWPSDPISLLTLAGRAVVQRELREEVFGLLHQAERFSVAWRWQGPRRRVMAGAAFPAPRPLPGVVSFDALWERQTYADIGRESRRRLTLSLSDWATSRVRWQAGVGTDRFDGRAYVASVAGMELRLADDRLALGVTAQGWVPSTGTTRFGAVGLIAAWRSTTESFRPVVFVSSTWDGVGASAPRAVWPSAGTSGRGRLLRAHPLFTDDVITGPLLGRKVTASSMEYWHPVKERLGQRLFVAAFVDAASASRLYVDAGIGLRVATLGGTLRADAAKGLRGGRLTWSAGWMTSWPRW